MGARRRSPGERPLFAFDLNVYFDLVRERAQSENARRLFGEALGHTLRLAVADEFVAELRRTSINASADPVLQMALQLPRLPKADASKLDALAQRVYDIVFGRTRHKAAGSDNAKSDAKHVAHAALSQASAFVTRDGPILNARQELLASCGIDIATVDEVLDLLPFELSDPDALTLRGDSFEPAPINANELRAYCNEVGVHNTATSDFLLSLSTDLYVRITAIRSGGRIVAIGALTISKTVDPIARLLIHVRHEHQEAELFADFLMEKLVQLACEGAVIRIELLHLNGQSIINRLALLRGFHRNTSALSFYKIAIGRPLTEENWASTAQQIRRRTGLVLADDFSALPRGGDIIIKSPTGALSKVDLVSLENLIGPTIIIWPGRNGVIVPITRCYADSSTRGYVSSPRSVKLMRPGSPIIFYESKRKGKGRGAAVAIARITTSVIVAKTQLDAKSDKRLVVDEADHFSATDDVLLTTFGDRMPFPTIVGLRKLKELKATGSMNLISAVSLSSEQITSILTFGWFGGKSR